MKQFLKILLIVGGIPAMLVAKYQNIHNDAEFDRELNKYQFALVCFAPTTGIDDQKDEFKNLKNRLIAASKRDNFKLLTKDFGFLMIDSSSKKLQDLSVDYKISKFPICLLFQDGKVVSSEKINPKTTSDIIKFVDKNIGKQLNDLIADRKEDRRLERQERMVDYYQYATSPWVNPPYTWMPYGYYPYSRWGVYPYGLGWNYDC